MLKPRRMTREEYKSRRQAIVMDVLHGMSYAEAAREYGMADATVRQAVKKELLRLRRHFNYPIDQWWARYHVTAKELYQQGVELVLLFDMMWKAQAK